MLDAHSHEVLRLLSGKWVLAIMTVLADGPLRFTDVRRAVGSDLSDEVLTSTLRRLEVSKLVEHTPAGSGYRLTPTARLLLDMLSPLLAWLSDYGHEIPLADTDH